MTEKLTVSHLPQSDASTSPTFHPTSTSLTLPRAELSQRLSYSMREVADVLGVSYVSVHRLAKRGLLRPSRALRTPLFSRAEVERFLRETC